MRISATLLFACFLAGGAVRAADNDSSFDWGLWRGVAVQDGGRYKPFDTLAWESLRTISNRGNVVDADTNEKLSPIAVYLTMLFEWQGWNGSAHPAMGVDIVADYFHAHQPDRWDQSGLLLVDSWEIRKLLGLGTTEKYVSALALSRAQVQDPQTGRSMPFLAWAELVGAKKPKDMTPLERKGMDLAERFSMYLNHRMGRRLEVLPLPGGSQQWISIAQLWQTDWNRQRDPTGRIGKAKESIQQMRAAFLAHQPAEFNRAAANFAEIVQTAGPQLGSYPQKSVLDLEVAYNRWVPFRFAWCLMLLAFVLLLFSLGAGWKAFYRTALVVFSAGLVAMLIGMAMRILISGRAPVTNMYESMIFVGAGCAAIGLVLEIIYRKRFILTAAAGVSTLVLILADNCPAVLDPSLRPLQPVLRSNFWLTTHVMSITLSYAAFALATGISDITLGYFLFGAGKRDTVAALSRFTYRCLQVGVLLLAAGTILGGIWAAYSWGKFWSWDPKENWALIALLGYLAVLHTRLMKWVSHLGLAALSVLCFCLVMMAWYGVNMLGAGMHSYGFSGNEGYLYVFLAVAIQLLYVLVACFRGTASRELPPAGEMASERPR
jgi:ABC-type transport system involved in cytochrome c biogenesis permease subunit